MSSISSPNISAISSAIPDCPIISAKKSPSTPDERNSSMSKSASSASPVASYTLRFSADDSTAYASDTALNSSGSPPLSGCRLQRERAVLLLDVGVAAVLVEAEAAVEVGLGAKHGASSLSRLR